MMRSWRQCKPNVCKPYTITITSVPQSQKSGTRYLGVFSRLEVRVATSNRLLGRTGDVTRTLGDNVYANFNLTLVDDTYIYIGNSVMTGPSVTIATAGRPIDPDLRRGVAQFNIPVRIGDVVWSGANSVVLPGVTIGENSVIGAGSIVTKDIPANVVAVGNPSRLLREVGQHDKEYYFKNRKLEQNIFNG